MRQIEEYEGLVAKFEQNPDLCAQLDETGNAMLAECAVKDRIWGIGLSMKNPARLDPAPRAMAWAKPAGLRIDARKEKDLPRIVNDEGTPHTERPNHKAFI